MNITTATCVDFRRRYFRENLGERAFLKTSSLLHYGCNDGRLPLKYSSNQRIYSMVTKLVAETYILQSFILIANLTLLCTTVSFYFLPDALVLCRIFFAESKEHQVCATGRYSIITMS